MTSSWFFLSTLNYDARSTTHQILVDVFLRNSSRCNPGYFKQFLSTMLNVSSSYVIACPIIKCSLLPPVQTQSTLWSVRTSVHPLVWRSAGFLSSRYRLSFRAVKSVVKNRWTNTSTHPGAVMVRSGTTLPAIKSGLSSFRFVTSLSCYAPSLVHSQFFQYPFVLVLYPCCF